MSEEGASLPISVLTGFLGSGKTTVLRELLAREAFGQSAVLVNEFGEVGIDHLLVDAISPDVVLLDSGCVCCQIRGELKEAVLNLLSQRASGSIPPFSRIVIETTGLAEPGPVVSTLAMDPVLSRQCEIGVIVTVVDAVAAASTQQRRREWLEQVAVADTLMLSKTDLVESDAAEHLITHLQALNPAASVIDWRADLDALDTAFRGRSLFPIAGGDIRPQRARTQQTRMEDQAPSQHGRALRSLILPLDRAIDWTSFGIWFSALLHAHGDRILRVKGLVDVGETGPMLLNSVQHSVYPPEHWDAWPDGARSQLVFIVDAIEPGMLEASFRHHVTCRDGDAVLPASLS